MNTHTQQKDGQFWTQFLPEINKTIAAALGSLDAQERILESMSESSAGDFTPRLTELRSRLEESSRRPEETMAAADALLQQAEEAYRAKLAGIEALRQKLADWAGRAIR